MATKRAEAIELEDDLPRLTGLDRACRSICWNCVPAHSYCNGRHIVQSRNAAAPNRDRREVRASQQERPHPRVNWAIVGEGEDAEHDVRPVAPDDQRQVATQCGTARRGRQDVERWHGRGDSPGDRVPWVADGRREPCNGRLLEPDRGGDLETLTLLIHDEDGGRFDLELLSDRANQDLQSRTETISMGERPSTSNEDLARRRWTYSLLVLANSGDAVRGSKSSGGAATQVGLVGCPLRRRKLGTSRSSSSKVSVP